MRAVNLIPSEQRSGASVGVGRSEGGAYALLALAAGLAVLALLYGSADRQITSRHAQAATIGAKAEQAQTQAARLAPYTSFIALREQRTQAVDTLVDSRFDWAHVFHEFGRVLPPESSISSLSGTVGAATTTGPVAQTGSSSSATSATPPGSVPTFTLSGCATSQSAVALTLERLRLIDGVKEVTLQSSTSSSSGGGAGAGCPAHDPTFAALVSFDPLPSAASVASAAKTVADSPSSRSAAGAPTSSGVNAK